MNRSLVLVALALAALMLVQLDEPAPQSPTGDARSSAAVADPQNPTTWFCAGGGFETQQSVTHWIIVSNPTDEPLSGSLTGFTAQSNGEMSQTFELEATSSKTFDLAEVGPDLTSASVELNRGGGVVSHRFSSESFTDTSACVTAAATDWHFPSADTRRGRWSQLWIMNPFPTDSSVDITVALADGVRAPVAFEGVVIPGRSARMIDIGETIQRRGQFAFSATTRSGRVIAELVATSDPTQLADDDPQRISAGLSMYPGVARTTDRWVFSDSFGGEKVSENLVLYNPGEVDTAVEVTVTPATADVAPPEPFAIDLPAQSFAEIALTSEARVPPAGRRWIAVRAFDDVGIAVARRVSISGPGGNESAATRPEVSAGRAISAGLSALSERFELTPIAASPDSQSVLTVTNPSTEVTATVQVTLYRGGNRTDATDGGLEVPPGSSVSLDLAPLLGDAALAGTVTADRAVAVEALTTSKSRPDISLFTAISVRPLASIASDS